MTIRPIDIDAPKASPAVPCKALGSLVITAYSVAALGRIVKDMAIEAYSDEEKSEYLDRLSALGECVDMLAKQLIAKIDDLLSAGNDLEQEGVQ